MQFWDFPKIAAFWENPEKKLVKFRKHSAKFWQILQHFVKKQQKKLTKKLRLENGANERLWIPKTVQRSALCRSRRELFK